MFGFPAPTPYDLNFRLLGVPVRVNPFFWALAAVLGWSDERGLSFVIRILIWIACVFVSVLVHEFGHALTARSVVRQRPKVLLYYMGGLCFYDSEHRNLWKRAMVLIMGPGAGFLLMGLVLFLGVLVLGEGGRFWPFYLIQVHPMPSWFTHLPVWLNYAIQWAYNDLLLINLIWGLFNLLPIYPLDGGQLANVFLTMHDRRQGPMRSYVLSMVAAGGIAIYLYSIGETINALFIASLAFLNFQLFQASRYEQDSYSSYGQDDDWRWK